MFRLEEDEKTKKSVIRVRPNGALFVWAQRQEMIGGSWLLERAVMDCEIAEKKHGTNQSAALVTPRITLDSGVYK